jgi:hypothetical protein
MKVVSWPVVSTGLPVVSIGFPVVSIGSPIMGVNGSCTQEGMSIENINVVNNINNIGYLLPGFFRMSLV